MHQSQLDQILKKGLEQSLKSSNWKRSKEQKNKHLFSETSIGFSDSIRSAYESVSQKFSIIGKKEFILWLKCCQNALAKIKAASFVSRGWERKSEVPLISRYGRGESLLLPDVGYELNHCEWEKWSDNTSLMYNRIFTGKKVHPNHRSSSGLISRISPFSG